MKQVRDAIVSLENSPLYEYRDKHGYYPVIGQGSHDAEIVFIGEAPGESEAKSGIPFCGRAGKMLDELLDHINLDREAVYITNVLKDRPPENRDPSEEEIRLYTPFLRRQIDIIEPQVIATLGRFAMDFILDNFTHEIGALKISEAHGQEYSVTTTSGDKISFIPLYHPAVALYNGSMRETLKADFVSLKKYL